MPSLIGALRISLGLETATFERDVNRAQSKMSKLTSGLATGAGIVGGALAAAGLSNLVGQAFEMASALDEDAQKMGVTVEALQELRTAAHENGVENDALQATMAKLNRSMGDLQQGKKAAVDAFTAIGLSATDLAGKSPEQALRLIADALNRLPDPQQRVAIGMQIMGRSFSDLLPLINAGSKGLDEAAQKTREHGELSTADAKALDQVADSWRDFKDAVLITVGRLIAAALPFGEKFSAMMEAWRTNLIENLKAVRDFGQAVIDWFTRAGNAIGDFLKRFNQGIAQSGKMKASLTEFAEQGTLQLASFGTTADAVSVRVQKSFKDMADATLSALDRLATSVKSGGFLGILSAVIGLGLQLGSIGVFGSTIAGRINNPGGAGGGSIPSVPRSPGGPITLASAYRSAPGTTVQVVPSPYFNVVVDGRVAGAAPSIASAGASAGVQKMAYAQSRRLA